MQEEVLVLVEKPFKVKFLGLHEHCGFIVFKVIFHGIVSFGGGKEKEKNSNAEKEVWRAL